MSDVVFTYTNYLGAEVVNDCPECRQSHFFKDFEFDEYGNAEYECNGEIILIHHTIG